MTSDLTLQAIEANITIGAYIAWMLMAVPVIGLATAAVVVLVEQVNKHIAHSRRNT